MMEEIDACQFYEKQWEFVAPLFEPFVLRRHLADYVILPFLSQKNIGSGGFGDVYDIDIDPAHQKFDDSIRQLVRKDLWPRSLDYENSERELENLSILKLLKHSSISQLLGCYTYRRVHSVIFPRATGGDLYSFLRSPLPEAFSNNGSFLLALAGLASAVACVHNPINEELDLTRIGCHHDLKPGNILVEKDKFILSDFGLARFKSTLESSATPFKMRQGFSIAPECQALDGKWETSLVWSFGTIMLEVATYMLRGPEGVEDFESKREFKIDWSYYTFFHMGRKDNPAVASWIQKLHSGAQDPEKLLLELIERMLQLDPESRPSAKEVEQSMIWIALLSLSQSDSKLFDTLCGMESVHEVSVKPWVEKKRFESWMRSLGFYDLSYERNKVLNGLNIEFERFQKLSDYLKTLIQELMSITRQEIDTQLRLLLPLRRLNTELYNQIPEAERRKALQISEILLLNTDRLEELIVFHGEKTSSLAKVSMLAQSKHDSQQAQLHPPTAHSQEISRPRIERSLGSHFLGKLTDNIGQATNVIIDYKSYDEPLQRQQLQIRMESLTRLC